MESRYELGETIGRGGMGEVIAAHDARIGREVAIKRIRIEKATEAARQRFVREARIQARLDHPAIVPVHDIGTDEAGLPFFTMKRLAGRTLLDALAEGASGPGLAELLRAFVEVCRAIEFAHAHGIVHRDLKPANIMLGDYGEVYVLDWGVACALSEDRETPVPRATPVPRVRGGAGTSDATTMAGALLGTAGYMAPEQMQSAAEVGTAADVYALGAVLFEILAGERLHPEGEAAIGSTLAGDAWSAAARRPDRVVAPELDALCAAALAWEPDARPSAHDLAVRVQRFLDGDRDVARRMSLAAACLADAHAAFAADRRAEAVAAAGRALALDPESRDAAALVARLLIEPPAALPAELSAQLDRTDAEMAKQRGRNAAHAYGSLLPLSLFVPFLRVRDWVPLIALWAAIALVMLLAWTTARTGRVRTWLVLGSGVVMAVLMSRLAGPFMLAPTIICGTLFSVTALPRVVPHRWITIAWIAAAALVPLVLEWVGVLSPTASVIDGHLSMRSAIFETHGPLDLAALVTANLVFLIVCGMYAHRNSRDRRRAERELHIRAWHLAKLLP